MKDVIFYGLTSAGQCSVILAFEGEDVDIPEIRDYLIDVASKNDYVNIIRRYEFKKSKSELNIYYRTTIFDSNMKVASIQIGDAKIIRISDEYWKDFGSLNQGKIVTYCSELVHPSNATLHLFMDDLLYKINDQTYGLKICFVYIEDSIGYRRPIIATIVDEEDIRMLYSNLNHLSYLKTYAPFQLSILMTKLNQIQAFDHDSLTKAKDHFSDVIIPAESVQNSVSGVKINTFH